MMTHTEAAGAMSFIFEAGMLKRAKRTGWWIAGIDDPESIAEHSFRTAIIGTVLAGMEGADPARVALLCLLHDIQETRTGDIPHNGRRYLTATDNETITADQVSGCPPAVADAIGSAVAEYETGETLEAVVARDADKLECLVQAVEYRHQGTGTVQPWIDSSRAALRTAAASRLADAALAGDPLGWLAPPP
jgi:putative hydrolase of HD superfamily